MVCSEVASSVTNIDAAKDSEIPHARWRCACGVLLVLALGLVAAAAALVLMCPADEQSVPAPAGLNPCAAAAVLAGHFRAQSADKVGRTWSGHPGEDKLAQMRSNLRSAEMSRAGSEAEAQDTLTDKDALEQLEQQRAERAERVKEQLEARRARAAAIAAEQEALAEQERLRAKEKAAAAAAVIAKQLEH